MKTFATSLSSALLIAGAASAQGIALFGDARLGLGYNIDNDGGVARRRGRQRARRPARHLPCPLRRQHDRRDRQRHHLRRDDPRRQRRRAARGAPRARPRARSSCPAAWGTLTYGDTDGADEQWVGDVPGQLLAHRPDRHQRDQVHLERRQLRRRRRRALRREPVRPSRRCATTSTSPGFGFSVSTNRDLTDIGVGAGYTADFAGGSWTAGAGYNKFDAFTTRGD